MRFFVGWHQPTRAHKVGRPHMLSANALCRLSEDYSLPVGEGDRWMMDSGAFSQISGEAGFYQSPAEYAIEVHRWCRFGNLVAAVTQDYMCEPHILHRLDTNAREQQERTVERYDEILGHLSHLDTDTHLMPVLQGWEPRHYKRHLEMYGDRLTEEMWVGVGSICKRNSSPADVEKVLSAITDCRPDLRLHGFGIKTTALRRARIRKMLYSADSMSWSYAARRKNGDSNSPKAARQFFDSLTEPQARGPLFDYA